MSTSQYSGLDIPLVPNYIRTYRLWRIDAVVGKLAAFNGIAWPAGQRLEAGCTVGGTFHQNEEIPVPGCTCGIYSRYDPNDLDDLVPNTGIVVAGVMDAFGSIELGTRGIKSQFATIRALCPIKAIDTKLNGVYYNKHTRANPLIADVVQNVYQLPLYKCMDDLVSEYPMEDLKSLGIDTEIRQDDSLDALAALLTQVQKMFTVSPPQITQSNTTSMTGRVHITHLPIQTGYHSPPQTYPTYPSPNYSHLHHPGLRAGSNSWTIQFKDESLIKKFLEDFGA